MLESLLGLFLSAAKVIKDIKTAKRFKRKVDFWCKKGCLFV